MPRCAMSCPCTENCLTKPSSFGRICRDTEGGSDPKKCQTIDGSGVGCLGNIGKLKYDVAPENARCVESRALSLACNREQDALSMTLSQ
jgi:hypothetical protein